MTTAAGASLDDTGALLRAHCDRDLDGRLDDPVDVAAVVAVERLAVALDTTDPASLRHELLDPRPELADLVAELVDVVDTARGRGLAGWSTNASLVNEEAGNHPISPDASLLRAGVRAAHATFVAIPYYLARYGARGARFSASDSSWLVGLVPKPLDYTVHQVTWLTGVLAARGMPSWLMERHLVELTTQIRTEGGDAGHLPDAADVLAARRRSAVSDADLLAADREAERRLERLPVPGTGALVAAAVADVRSGVATDDRALMDWLTDPGRLSEADAEALRGLRDELLAAAAPAAR
ncbi:MAG: hypothetical protein PGN07_03295 [Aeromicrobium erythreum]